MDKKIKPGDIVKNDKNLFFVCKYIGESIIEVLTLSKDVTRWAWPFYRINLKVSQCVRANLSKENLESLPRNSQYLIRHSSEVLNIYVDEITEGEYIIDEDDNEVQEDDLLLYHVLLCESRSFCDFIDYLDPDLSIEENLKYDIDEDNLTFVAFYK